MSSLRLALKQSLEDTTKIDTDHHHRRRLKKLKKKKKLLAAAQAAAAAGNASGEGAVVNTEGAAGTTNLQEGGNDVGAAIHYLKPAPTTSGIRDPLKDGSASSSTLSSSDDDDEDDSSSSSSSSSSDSSSSSSDDDSDDDDDDDSSSSSSDSDSSSSSSDSSSSSEDNDTVDREAKQLFDADLSSSESDEHHHVVTTHHDGSNPMMMMMMDEDENSSTDKRRRKRLKKQSKTKLKARRKQQRERRDQNDAAVLIQSHWKKKAQGGGGDVDIGGGNVEEGRGYRPDTTHDGGEMKQPPLPTAVATTTAGEEQPTNNPPSTTTTATATSKKTSKTVEPPHPQILHHITLMSEKRQRRSIHTNLRVKVRFVKKANIQGKLTRKLKWYGGVIVGIGNKGRKVKIEYDDGTSEVADFPDKDIIVDDVNNGVHGSAVVGEGEKVVNKGGAFRPRSGGVMVGGEDSKKEGGGGGGEKKQGGMMNVDDIIVGAQVPATTVKELSLSPPPEEMSQDKFVEPTPRLVSNEIVVEGAAAVDEAASSIVKELSTNENETSMSTPQQQRNAPLANTAVAAADEKEEEKEEASSEEEGEILEETTAPTPAISTFAPTPAAVEETNNTIVPGGFMAQGQLNPIVTKDADVPMMSSSLPQKEAESVPPSHGSDEKKKIDESLTIGTTTTAAVPSPSKKMAAEKEKEDNASSSSGSTCSSVSFAGPSSAADAAAAVAGPAAVVKTNAENVPVEMPSHVDVNNGEDANGKATLFDDDEEEAKEPESSNGNDDDDDEEEEGEIDEGDEAASSPPKDEPPVPKKRGPLRIRIGLSAAVKRKIEEEMDAMNEATPRSKKKAKLSSDDGDGDANMEDAPADVALPSTETTEKLKEPQGNMTEELAPKKRKSFDSEDASDGENQEGSGSKKASGVDGVAPPQRKKPGRKKKMTEIEKLKQDSIIEKTKQDSTLQDKDISMNEAVDVDSGKSPRSFNSDTPEDDNAFSMARVGRKAAQRAAEKIAEKKTKKRNKDSAKESTEENTTTTTAAPAVKAKKEEDPWVQCDRCHKWRHLPATVNLDDLPEHWFCELNTHDPKRNNCEAAEQTPKEVAKEKKRAKKLAWKKLQMEQAQALAKEGSKKRARSASPPPRGIDKEAEFDTVVATSVDKKSDDHVVNEATVAPPTTEPLPPKPKRRGRPPRSDKEKEKTPPNAPNAAPGGKGKDAPKQEWVQCEKCEKWRRLPPRISAEELPDVWYCSMNTWDINLATCTAIEDKHEENSKEYNVQSQIPTFAGSSSKTSYRNLIFGNGRQKRNISERMRAQESLFARDEEVDMSAPPTAMYAKSSAFFNKSLAKASAQETNKVLQPSIFDYMACSRVWAELNHMRRPNSKQHLYGYDKFCQPDGSLNKDSIDTLKAMSYFALGTNVLSGNEVLLQVQLQQWGYEVPTSWLELRSLSTIEIVNFILDELIKDGLVECIVLDKLSLDNVLYRQRTISSEESPQQQGIQAPAGCLKISKPWK